MIVSTFKTGKGKARGPLNYLLGNDKKNQPRDPAPVLLKGDKKLTEVLIDSNQRQHKYTSGVIAFRDNEHPTDEQMQSIIEAFETTFTPQLQERVPILWVKHQEKGNTELHFVAPMQDAKTGKQVNICPPGEGFKQMYRDFQTMMNDRFGWEQVRPSVFQSEMKKIEAVAQHAGVKTLLSSELEKHAKTGQMKNRDDFIDWVTQKGFELTRKGKDYISIKHKKSPKAMRLKGPAFAQGASYAELLEQSALPPKLSLEEREATKKRLVRAIKNRHSSLMNHLEKVPLRKLAEPTSEVLPTLTTEHINEVRKQPQATPDLPQISSQRLKI